MNLFDRTSRPNPRRTCRPHLETLESRIVMDQSFRYFVPEGVEFTPVRLGSFTLRDRAPGDLKATVTWGDGTTTTEPVRPKENAAGPFQFEIKASHRFHDEGPVTGATVTVEDTKTGRVFQVAHGGFNVQPAPIEGAGKTATATAGQSEPIIVSLFTDLDPEGAEDISHYGARILWGDGTSSPGQLLRAGDSFAVSGHHAYSKPGVYQVTTEFWEDDGGKWAGASVYRSKARATGTVVVDAVVPVGKVVRTAAELTRTLIETGRAMLQSKAKAYRIGDNGVRLADTFMRTLVDGLFPKPPAQGANLFHHAVDFTHGFVESMLLDMAEMAARGGMIMHNPTGALLNLAEAFPAEHELGQMLGARPGLAPKLLKGYVDEMIQQVGERPGYAAGRVLPAILDGATLIKGGTKLSGGVARTFEDVLAGKGKVPISDLQFPNRVPGKVQKPIIEHPTSRPIQGLGTPVQGLPAAFDRHLEVANATGPQMDRLAIEIRNTILNNPVGQAAARHVVETAGAKEGPVKVVLDFAPNPGRGVDGYFDPYRREIRIYVDEHATVTDIGETFVHETKHVRFDSTGNYRKNSLYEEYFANVRSFLYSDGRRPTALERAKIWEHVQLGYWERVINGQMTVSIDDLLTRPYGLKAKFTGWPGLW